MVLHRRSHLINGLSPSATTQLNRQWLLRRGNGALASKAFCTAILGVKRYGAPMFAEGGDFEIIHAPSNTYLLSRHSSIDHFQALSLNFIVCFETDYREKLSLMTRTRKTLPYEVLIIRP